MSPLAAFPRATALSISVMTGSRNATRGLCWMACCCGRPHGRGSPEQDRSKTDPQDDVRAPPITLHTVVVADICSATMSRRW